MKNHQRTATLVRHLYSLALAACLALPMTVPAASLTLATSPLATSTTSSVLPNVYLMMDNSGSMDWEHMPDDSSDAGSSVPFTYGYYGLRSSQCNMVYYDPNTTYLAPVDSTGLPYTDASFNNARRNGFSAASCTSSTCINLDTGFQASVDSSSVSSDTIGQSAYYYSYSGSLLTQTQKEYNSNSNAFYKECHDSTGSSVSAIAPVNGVKALTGGAPSPAGSGVFTKHRYATTETTTITISGSATVATPVTSVQVNGVELLNAATSGSTSSSTVATNIRDKINLRTAISGFSATASGSVVTITGPTSAADYTPVISYGGTFILTPDVFPDTTASKLTNFANWYSFYRTRLLMMKTATGRAFKTLDNHYRVGFGRISSSSTPTVYLDTFTGTQRSNWYTALYNTSTSGSTPLREALANAGWYYTGKLSGADPVQYSCQQNFTIMSTDGFWNGNAGFKVNSTSTMVGNQDGSADRPMYDGSNITKTTTTIGQSQTQTTMKTSSLMGTLSKVLMRCNNTAATCGAAPASGVANANWSVVTSGSCNTSSSVQCAAVSGLSGISAVATTCNTSANITTSTVATFKITVTGVSSATRLNSVKIDGNELLTGKTSSSSNSGGNTNNNLAANIQANIGNGYSSSVSGNVISITKSVITGSSTLTSYNVSNGGPATLTGSTIVTGTTYTLNNADTNGKIYSSCAYTAWSAGTLTIASGCTQANQSATPNNTSVVSAVQCTVATIQAPTLVASCTPGNTGSPNYIETVCTPSSPVVQNNLTSCTPESPTSSNGYKTVTCSTGTGGTSDTLADVAMYYYQTDLRTSTLNNCTGAAGVDVCLNNVFKTDTDSQTQQHMATFTLGLGASGLMKYSPTYLTDTSGDFYSIKIDNTKADSTKSPPVCSWQADGTTCNWPDPGSGGALTTIDDLWHAAVDGHGQYFSATSPASLSSGLSNALAAIASRKGASAAAATSTLNPVAGNNYAYVASYTTVKWLGNLEARTIDVNTGVISPSASWCVEPIAQGDCATPATVVVTTSGSSTVYSCVTSGSTSATCASPGVFDGSNNTCNVPMATSCPGTMPGMVGANSDTRTIYTRNTAGTALTNFDAAYATANPVNFAAAHINTLSQWSSFTATQKTAAEGVNLINFLRGQTGYEDRAANLVGAVDNRLYRYREATMGDALESQPIYIGKPVFSYADKGYSSYLSAQSGRVGTVYMGTNDGMLHAFSALAEGSVPGGTERWAYVPSMVIPNMWKLADKDYANLHTNYVNGSPIVSDVCTANCLDTDLGSAVWRTILVGGLNAGGRGYYALDVTNPAAPTLLWEFTTANDSDVGYSYGNPVITAKADGTWVVLLTSGYNNTSPGTGQEFLYVLNAGTGTIISKIGTGVGTSTTPGGLAKISAWNDTSSSNRATYVYGGDLLGNLWRFDINSAAAVTYGTGTGSVFDLATLMGPSGNPQAITTPPVLGKIGGKRVVFVGTGKYLENADLSTTQVQSEYAIKDDNATVTLSNPGGSPRNSTTLVQQTLTNTGNGTRTASGNPVDWTTGRGWYVDFPDSGERSNIESRLVLGTLLVATIVPSNTVCSPGGYGWLNFFDYLTGGSIDSSGIVSASYNNSIVGINVLYINGQPVIETVTSNDPTPTVNTDVLIKGIPSGFVGKRVLWRELHP